MSSLNRRSKAGNYTFLLSGLLILFILMPLTRSVPVLAEKALIMRITLQAGYCSLMLLGVWSLPRQNYLFRFGLLLTLLNVIFTIINLVHNGIVVELLTIAFVLLFSVCSAVIAAQHVFQAPKVDHNLIFGAMCVYLLMGLIWAILYGLIFQFSPNSFNGIESVDGKPPMDTLLYFSFVTLASLGYGDITPAAPMARTLAYLEAIGGQLYIAIMLAGLVGVFMNERKR